MSTGVGHLARWVETGGNPIENENMLFPYEIILEPNRAVFSPNLVKDGQDFLEYFEQEEFKFT